MTSGGAPAIFVLVTGAALFIIERFTRSPGSSGGAQTQPYQARDASSLRGDVEER